MIHTKVRQTALSGMNRDIEPKDISKPKGSAAISVTKNKSQFCLKPCKSCKVTYQN